MIGIATFIWAGDMGYFCDDLWATYWKNVTEDRWDAVGSGKIHPAWGYPGYAQIGAAAFGQRGNGAHSQD
jgi:hypothetical protein